MNITQGTAKNVPHNKTFSITFVLILNVQIMDRGKIALYKPYLFILLIFIIPLLTFLVLKWQLGDQPGKNINNYPEKPKYAIVIHGGAGNFKRGDFTNDEEKAYKNALSKTLEMGIAMLQNGDSAVNVVEKLITVLEDDSLFNAGCGAALTIDGKAELDASIMDGYTLKAGAVASVTRIKNPIRAARKVMDVTPHVLLCGAGADEFALNNNLEIVPNSYFITHKSIERLESFKQKKARNEKNGTVGCVVFDQYGNLAAGTSTGGMTGKMTGRVGDSPIIGAGTYANNNTCAVSATGHGEFFIKYSVASTLSNLIEYKGISAQKAADYMIDEILKDAGADGGIILIDKNGSITISFNTTGMFRGFASQGILPVVELYQ